MWRARQAASLRLDMLSMRWPPTLHAALAGPVEAADQVEQGGFAGTRGAHQGEELALGNLQVQATQYVHFFRATLEDLVDVAGRRTRVLLAESRSPTGSPANSLSPMTLSPSSRSNRLLPASVEFRTFDSPGNAEISRHLDQHGPPRGLRITSSPPSRPAVPDIVVLAIGRRRKRTFPRHAWSTHPG